jgi:hypothetical protein
MELLQQWQLEQVVPPEALDSVADEAVLAVLARDEVQDRVLVLARGEVQDRVLVLARGEVQDRVLVLAAAQAEARAPQHWARRTKPVRKAKRM